MEPAPWCWQGQRRGIGSLLATVASAAQARSLKRVGSANNLAPPTMANSSHLSRSLPPSPQHSPASSRKVIIKGVNLVTALQTHCPVLLTRSLATLGYDIFISQCFRNQCCIMIVVLPFFQVHKPLLCRQLWRWIIVDSGAVRKSASVAGHNNPHKACNSLNINILTSRIWHVMF